MKTRSLATKECTGERVRLNAELVKASKEVKIGDEISIRKGPVWKRYEIIAIPKSRVGAALVAGLIKETTHWEDLELLERIEMENRMNRQAGQFGRPTKKVRRTMDRYKTDLEDPDKDYD